MTTAKEIAEYFRSSVSFDFSKETISSYAQIRRDEEKFFTLVDREAFSALLNDFLNYDNQLKDIFIDLFDAERGIQDFANAAARTSPRGRIVFFLNQPKYRYHKNDLAKVYLAVNTWLCFFGGQEIRPEWEACPFCTSPVSKGVCTNPKCKKTADECLNTMSELAEVLLGEQTGKPTHTPKDWELIKEGSEFFIEYKSEIAARRKAREREQLAKAEQETRKLAVKKQAEADSLAKASREREFKETVASFLYCESTLARELISPTKPFSVFKRIFEDANREYAKVLSGMKSGMPLPSKESQKALIQFERETLSKANDYIQKGESEQRFSELQKELSTRVNLLWTELCAIRPRDGKAREMLRRFNKEIEQSGEFDEFKVERKKQYDELLAPLREKLSELVKAENEQRLSEFKIKANALFREISVAEPSEMKSSVMAERLDGITKGEHFAGIRSNADYINTVNVIKEKLEDLKSRERKLLEELAKREWRKKRRRKAMKILFALTVVLAAGLFLTLAILKKSGIL